MYDVLYIYTVADLDSGYAIQASYSEAAEPPDDKEWTPPIDIYIYKKYAFVADFAFVLASNWFRKVTRLNARDENNADWLIEFLDEMARG